MRRLGTLLFVVCITSIISDASVNSSKKSASLPPAFVRNVGQVSYTSGRPASHVDGIFSVGGTTALVHPGGMHIVQMVPSGTEYDMYRMDMVLIGSNRNARLEWQAEQMGYSRYLTSPTDGPEGRTAQHYARMYYHDVWPGIDMRMYIVGGGIEYDFIVHPRADPNRIAFMMDGAQEMGLTADNGLKVSTPLGTMSEAAPYSYVYRDFETKVNGVDSRFVVDGRTVRFAVGAYDRTQTLVIDPRRVWATYFGFNQEVTSLNSAVDIFGNVLLLGGTAATNLPEVTGVLQKRWKARTDGFIAKFNEFGEFVWSTYFGGSGDDKITGACSDQHGNVYVCGETGSELNTLPQLLGVGSAPWGDPDSLGVTNGFVLGLTPNGAWIDHWFLYGRNEDAVNDIAFRNDKLAIVGTSRSVRVCEQVGSPYSHNDSNNYRNEDVFVAQFSRNTAQVNRWKGDWLSFVGGVWDDKGVAVAIDAQGSVYIGATIQDVGIQVTDGSSGGGSADVYVAKFTGGNSVATHNWGSIVGGDSTDQLMDIAVDEAGGVVTVGSTRSVNFHLKNAMNGVRQGRFDGFIRKYKSADGTVQWSTLFGGKADDFLNSIAIDQSNRIWICGLSIHTESLTQPVVLIPPDMPVTTDAFQSTTANTIERNPICWKVSTGYFAQISADGQTVMYGSYYGAPPDSPLPPCDPPGPPILDYEDDLGHCQAVGITCDANGNIVVVHIANTLHMDTTAGAYQDSSRLDHTNHKASVPFLSLFTNCTPQDVVSTVNGSSALCVGDTRQIIGPTGFVTYLWSTGATTKNITVSDSGHYVLIVKNADGCRFRDTVVITRNAKPIVNAGLDLSRCKDTVVTLTAAVTSGTAPYKFKWSRIESGPEYIDTDTSQTPNVNPPTTSQYEVVVTDVVGCISKDTIRISIVDPKPTGPVLVDFGTLDACDPTKDADVTITNPMPYDLRLDGFSSDIASIVTSLTPPPIIPANSSTIVSVRISPTQVGVTNGTLRFTGSPCAWSVNVPYRVNKARLTATVSPSTIGFGASADCETVQRDSTVVIKNGSPDVMTVNPGVFTAGGPPFSVLSPLIPTDVAPGDSLIVVIRYQPLTTGSFGTVLTFQFTAGTCNGTLIVNLNASRSSVNITVEPSDLDVGTIGGCQDFSDTTFTITNPGDVAITVTLPAIGGIAFTPPGPITLAAGATQVIAVRITPIAQGPFSVSGEVKAEPCNITKTMTFSGRKAGAGVNVPASLDFGELSGCTSPDFVTRPFNIVYDGSGDANVVTVQHGTTIQTTMLSGMLLVPGVPQTFDVTWTPVSDGAFVDSLVLVVEPCSIRRVIRLTGERTNVALTASTPLVNLGAVTGPEVGQLVFINSGTDTISAVASALTPDVSITSTVPTTLTSILPGGSIQVNYEVNCNGRTDVLDTIQVSSITPCVVEATSAFTGTCAAGPLASADIDIDTARVQTGDTFLVPLRLVRSSGLNAANAHAWTARITYNPGVIVGTGATPDCFTGVFEPCTIDIQGTRGSDTVGTLALLNFRAVLGTDSVSALTLESFAWTDATVDPITTRDGHVVLTDICEAGGARLLKPKSGAFTVELKPAPVLQQGTITARELGVNVAAFRIHNIVGTHIASGVLTPDANGTAEATLDATPLGAGTYILTVEARGHVFRKAFFVNR